MFSKPVVFIIGAGASNELGLPLGSGLKNVVSSSLNFKFDRGALSTGDPKLYEAVRHITKGDRDKTESFRRAGMLISSVMPSFVSIDEALHYWSEKPDFVTLGKLAIARSILQAEAKSEIRIKPDHKVNIDSAADTWIGHFLSIALSGLKRDAVEEAFSNVTMINFNYDRVVEHFLHTALQVRAAIPSDGAAATLSKLKTIRPYGSLGELPWISSAGINYGEDPGVQALIGLANKIRTYTEQQQSGDLTTEICEAIAKSALVVIVGFGFHRQNMMLLKPSKQTGIGRPVLCTVSGIYDANHPKLRTRLMTLIGGNYLPQLFDMKGQELISLMRPTIMELVG